MSDGGGDPRGDLERRLAEAEQKLHEAEAERDAARERDAATAEILKIIASSPSDVQPVFQAIADSAKRLLHGVLSNVVQYVGDSVQLRAFTPTNPDADAALIASFPRPIANNLVVEALQRGDSLAIADAEADDRMGYRERARMMGWRSLMASPLVNRGATIGSVAVMRAEPGAFAAEDVQLLRTFADQAVIAIENARLFKETQEALERQTATAEILQVVSSSVADAQPVLDKILDSCGKLFRTLLMTINLMDEDGLIHLAALQSRPGWGPEIDARLPELTEGRSSVYPIKVDAAVRAALESNREVRAWADVLNEPGAYNSLRQAASQMGTSYATMIAPMFAADRYVGNIAVSRRAGDGFTASEQSLLKSFADQAVIAIENARLFNETQRALERQTATSEILKVIAASPSDTTPVFDAIALSANRLLGGLSTAVWRFEGDIAHLASYTPTGPEADAALRALSPMPVSQLSVFVLLRGGEIAELPDTEEGPPQLRDLARLRGYRSMLFVPLVLNGDAIGFVSVTRKLPGKYDPEDVQLLKTFADQAVIAIQNARMFNETKEALEQQKASAGVLGAIGRSVSDATPVFEEILTACQRLFGLNEMGIYTVDSDDMVRVAAWRGETRAEVKHDVTPLADSITGRILRERRTHHIPDLIEEPNLSPLVRERAERLGSASLLYAPMLLEDRGLGSILVVRSPPKPFTERETELLKTFADQAAIAIENARLFKETKEALERQEATGEILSAIGQSVSDAAPVFEKVLDACERLFAAHGIGIFLAGDDGMVRAAAIRGARAGEARNDVTPYADSVTAKVIEARTVHHIPDEAALPNLSDRIRDRVRRHGPSSLLYAPMLWKDRGLGSIVVRRAPPRPFGDKEQALLQSFANQAAIAIENARLFNETQARTKELSESLKQQTATSEVLKVISRSAFDLQVVLDTLVASARELCEADQGIIWIREGDLFRAKAAIGFDGSVKAFYALHPRRVSDKSLVPRVMRSGQVEHIPDTKLDPDYEPIAGQAEADRPRTLLGVPLVHGERVDGVVTVTRRRAEAFLPRQIELVRTFADQAVIAIENSRLFGEVQARTRELAASLEDLRRTQDRLVQTEKLASLGQLTAGIAHEIKNPLNFINNFSALSGELADELLEALAPAPLDAKTRDEVDDLARMIKDNLQKVVHHGKRADSIVKNMLLHSRTGASEHRLTDINATLEESLNLAYHGARAEKPGFNITMKRDLDPGAGMADVFPQEISRAFLNLISNGFYAAAKRAEGGGVEPELWVATKNLGETIEIRIRDNGTGIPEEIREKIFNPFFTTKPAGEGTGLGLSMTHDIVVKQHGGALDVESSPGSYTEFRIVLPRGGAPIREGERH